MMLEAGAKAPSFALDDIAGNQRELSKILSDGPALIALYKVSCPVCQVTLPYLERIAGGSLQIIAISQDDERDTRRFSEAYRMTIPTLLDRAKAGYPVSNAFGISRVPSLFLVEQDGAISLASEGFVKRDLEAIGQRAGVGPFRPEDNVPEWKAG
jgi:peroxiredoxin